MSIKKKLAALGLAAVTTTGVQGCLNVGNPAPAPYDAGTDAGPTPQDVGPGTTSDAAADEDAGG